MLKLVSDENFNGKVVEGLARHYPEIDIVRVQDVGLMATPDPLILEWAAGEDRILLTHDHETVPGFAFDRVRAGQPMPGVFAVDDLRGIGAMMDAIAMAVLCSFDDEWKDQVLFLPLR